MAALGLEVIDNIDIILCLVLLVGIDVVCREAFRMGSLFGSHEDKRHSVFA